MDDAPRDARDESVDAARAASAILETVPPVMRAIRGRMRQAGAAGLSVPQFRAMLYVRRHPGTPLSGIAEHLGTTLPATSELVKRLVRQGLLTREPDDRERRRIRLTLTDAGAAGLDDARERTLRWLHDVVAPLEPGRLAALVAALTDLGGLLGHGETETRTGPGGEEVATVGGQASAVGSRPAPTSGRPRRTGRTRPEP